MPGSAAAMRGFDRMQTQKIRKPKKDKEEARGNRRGNRTTCPGRRLRLRDLGRRDEEPKAGEAKTGERRRLTTRRRATSRRKTNGTKRQSGKSRSPTKLRELEEKLKKLEVASDLAKARMANAAETAEKASGRWPAATRTRRPKPPRRQRPSSTSWPGRSRASSAREVAAELAMARDLADELAEREAEFGQMPGETPDAGPQPR